MIKSVRALIIPILAAVLLTSCGIGEVGFETEATDTGTETERTVVPPKETEKPKPPVYTFPQAPLPTGELIDSIKVMTYNIQGGKPDGRTLTVRSTYHAAKINLVSPDIVLLSEARNFDRRDQDLNIGTLTSKCDVPYGIVQFSAEKSTNAILYNNEKFDCISSEVIQLAEGGDEYSRSAVRAVLSLKQSGEELVAVATHLDLNMFAANEQIWEILDHLEENYSEYETQIVAGDLNFQSFQATLLGGPNGVHEEGLMKCGFYSSNIKNDRTCTFGSKILDYVYFKGAYPQAYRVIRDAVGEYEPSDHYPVYTELGIYS